MLHFNRTSQQINTQLCTYTTLQSRPALGSTQPPIKWVPGVKLQGRKVDHSPTASAEVKKMWIYTSTPPYAFITQCLISEAQGQVYILHNTSISHLTDSTKWLQLMSTTAGLHLLNGPVNFSVFPDILASVSCTDDETFCHSCVEFYPTAMDAQSTSAATTPPNNTRRDITHKL
jgi:hypothetical protein